MLPADRCPRASRRSTLRRPSRSAHRVGPVARTPRRERARLEREPRLDVKPELRSEVNFGCPVDGCGSPYLAYHHFDPPWKEEQHHRPAGMIALCARHHDEADGGRWTRLQLRGMKSSPYLRESGELPTGGRKLRWQREHLLVRAGGSLYIRQPTCWSSTKPCHLPYKGRRRVRKSRSSRAHRTGGRVRTSVRGRRRFSARELPARRPARERDARTRRRAGYRPATRARGRGRWGASPSRRATSRSRIYRSRSGRSRERAARTPISRSTRCSNWRAAIACRCCGRKRTVDHAASQQPCTPCSAEQH